MKYVRTFFFMPRSFGDGLPRAPCSPRSACDRLGHVSAVPQAANGVLGTERRGFALVAPA